MKKKLIITLFIMIIIIQAIMPIMVYADNSTDKKSIFNKNTTFSWKTFEDNEDGLLDYGLCIPSNANEYEKIPLIVWLHGMGETGTNLNEIRHTGLPRAIIDNESNREGFAAYVLCPLFPNNNVNRIVFSWND